MNSRPSPPAPTIAKIGASSRAASEPDAGAENSAPRIDRDDANVALRLSIGRNGIGFELARPAHLDTVLVVRELDVSLPGVRFPLDVSGGMARFRHRRGDLTRLSVEVPRAAAARWIASKLRGLVSIEAPSVWLRARPAAATIAIVAPDTDSDRPPAVLAFEVVMDAHGRDLRLFVAEARGTGLASPPTALALNAVARLLGKAASREGATFHLNDALGRLARRLFPDAGVRAPSVRHAAWSSSGASSDDDAWILQASVRAADVEPTKEAVRAREVSRLCTAADDARASGDLVEARRRDLAALAGAAGHPEIARRVAEIDLAAGERAEAALATLRDAERLAPARSGTLRAELLETSGNRDGARASYIRTGEAEEVPALAARAFEKAAELTVDAVDALVWLDRAVAELPESTRLRWARARRRIAAGRIDDARADVEAIAATSSGGRAAYLIWRRAADTWARGGLRAEASALYERALRWVPDDPAALAGLGEALADGGRAARGATLIARAIDLAEARGEDTSSMQLALATILAEKLADLPAAAARARSVASDSRECARARGLEGRWRASLGDRVGASLAFARLREAADERAGQANAANEANLSEGTDVHLTVELLAEAAAFERDVRGDLSSAQRLLGTALDLSPRDAALQQAYREVGARVAPTAFTESFVPRLTPAADAAPLAEEASELLQLAPSHAPARSRFGTDDVVSVLSAPVPAFATEPPSQPPPSFAPPPEPEEVFDEAWAANRVEELTAILRARPEDDAIVDELARLLTGLDRSFDLLALLSARLEEASPSVRARLLPRQRTVLQSLAEQADADGRSSEATLFRDFLESLADG